MNLTKAIFWKMRFPKFISSSSSFRSFALSSAVSSGQEVQLDMIENQNGIGGKIGILSFNRSGKKNAMSKNFLNQLHGYTLILGREDSVRVVILRSLVPGIFCSGADLKERLAMTNAQTWHHTVNQRRIMNELENLSMPVIAAIDGGAFGGGLEIALACDLRVAANNAKMGLVETTLAIIPGAGGTQRLSRVVGGAMANELIYTGRILNGEQSVKIGLVNRLVPQNENGDSAFNSALELAKEISENGPIAVRVAKFAISHGSEMDLATGMTLEENCYAQVIPTKDRIEGLLAFKEKRKPIYTGE